MFPLDKGLQWVNKARAIQTNLGTFRHNQVYPGIIQAYSGIFRTLCYPDIFYNCGISRKLTYSETEAYSEPRYIQNADKFEAHLEPSTSTMSRYFHGCNYFHKL